MAVGLAYAFFLLSELVLAVLHEFDAGVDVLFDYRETVGRGVERADLALGSIEFRAFGGKSVVEIIDGLLEFLGGVDNVRLELAAVTAKDFNVVLLIRLENTVRTMDLVRARETY